MRWRHPHQPRGAALSADGLRVDQDLFCREGFTTRGEVRLLGAHIKGNLELGGAALTNTEGAALSAYGLSVDQDLSCSEGFTAQGEVNLVGAHVGGTLAFNGAILTNPEGIALSADGLRVDQSMFCQEGFTARGEVNLRGAHVGGQLGFERATLTNPDGHALRLQEVRASTLFLRDLTEPPALIEFTAAQIGTLLDEPASWPRQAILDGFVYDALFEDVPVSARQRLGWLARNRSGYSPQPYEQLAVVYRRAGRDQDARTVAIAKQRARRRTRALPGRLWSLLLDGLVGYGYRTWLAGVWLLGLLAIGAAIFAWAHPADMALAKKVGDPLPAFQPWVYSLDVLLPVVNLHQEEFWIPQGVARWWAWFSILAGWLLTTVVIAALSGLLKKE